MQLVQTPKFEDGGFVLTEFTWTFMSSVGWHFFACPSLFFAITTPHVWKYENIAQTISAMLVTMINITAFSGFSISFLTKM